MNSKQNLDNKEGFSKEIEASELVSVDDFIKELEAKEKDLHISSDLVIEIEDSEFDDKNVPEFLQAVLDLEQESAPAPRPVPKPVIPAKKTFPEMENEISELKNQIARMETERAEVFENSRRRQKDFDNYRNRTERERHETFTNQISNLATQMLPVLDNLNRALDFAADGTSEKAGEFQQFFQGIFLVNQQLNEILAGMGVQPISSVGERFDPHWHEAVAIEETEKFPPQTVSAELLRGYRIGDRVIRPSMVKVATAVKAQAAGSSGENSENSNDIVFELE
jgi:molecular chaperone GrpE